MEKVKWNSVKQNKIDLNDRKIKTFPPSPVSHLKKCIYYIISPCIQLKEAHLCIFKKAILFCGTHFCLMSQSVSSVNSSDVNGQRDVMASKILQEWVSRWSMVMSHNVTLLSDRTIKK